MIDILNHMNKEIAQAHDLDAAIVALRICVLEEKQDLRAVDEKGTVLAVGFYVPENVRVSVVQGTQRRLVSPQPFDPRPFAPTRLDERD